MIVYKNWKKMHEGIELERWEGWFLFGFIPLYIRRVWKIQ